MPTAIWSWQMRSGSSHCDLQLATMKHEEYEEVGGGKRRRRRSRARVTWQVGKNGDFPQLCYITRGYTFYK